MDLEAYIGMSCQVLVVHNETEDHVYANIESVLPYKDAKGRITYFELEASGTYQRVIERPDYKTPEEIALNGA